MKCCVCKKDIKGFDNNALPLMDGRCCDKCNNEYVLPLRLYLTGKDREHILILNVDNTYSIEAVESDLSLERMQSIVEGYIEIYPSKNKDFYFIVNEEGLLRNMKVNELFSNIFGLRAVGNVLVCPKNLLK